MKKPFVSALFVAIAVAGCGATESGDVAANTTTSRTAKARQAAQDSGIDPCATLDETLIRKHFEVGGAELS